MNQPEFSRVLISRLARLDAAEAWKEDLNPAQSAALEYLASANRFSRSPSQVAEYLGTTRGTASQTLKALERKGFTTEVRSKTDKRSITYDITVSGRIHVDRHKALVTAIKDLSLEEQNELKRILLSVLNKQLEANGGRAFGVCH